MQACWAATKISLSFARLPPCARRQARLDQAIPWRGSRRPTSTCSYAEQFWAFTRQKELGLQQCAACGKLSVVIINGAWPEAGLRGGLGLVG